MNDSITTPEENFKTFCSYLGTGNINSKIWFVGIEEGGEAISESNFEEILENCNKETLYIDESKYNSSVWNIIADLIFDKYKLDHGFNDIKEFKNKMFSEDYSYFFLTDLFPLPKAKVHDWPEEYETLFGYGKDDLYKYYSDVCTTRYPTIYKKWIEVKPGLTICFGTTYWSEFINMFKLVHTPFIKYEGLNIFHYPKENVILTPFFDYRKIKLDERNKVKELIDQV